MPHSKAYFEVLIHLFSNHKLPIQACDLGVFLKKLRRITSRRQYNCLHQSRVNAIYLNELELFPANRIDEESSFFHVHNNQKEEEDDVNGRSS